MNLLIQQVDLVISKGGTAGFIGCPHRIGRYTYIRGRVGL